MNFSGFFSAGQKKRVGVMIYRRRETIVLPTSMIWGDGIIACIIYSYTHTHWGSPGRVQVAKLDLMQT